MNHKEKIDILKSLDEQALRRDVIIPLLSKMGFYSPIEYHGSQERGKDVICYDYNKLGENQYLSVVAKTTDFTGTVSGKQGLRETVFQIEQSLDIAYKDIYNMREVYINEVWVITTGRLTSGAEESIFASLQKNNTDKRVKIIPGSRLVELIDKHFDTYWNSATETKETVIIQRDRLLSFMEKMLLLFGSTEESVGSIRSKLLYSTEEPKIRSVKEGVYVYSSNSYSIDIATIDAEFDDYIYTGPCGLVKEQFAQVRDAFKFPVWELQETIEKAEKVMQLDNPQEFVTLFQDKLYGEYPFEDRSYGVAGRFMDLFRSLRDGVEDLGRFKEFLRERQLLHWFKATAKSIHGLQETLRLIISNTPIPEIHIQFSIEGEVVIIVDELDSVRTHFRVVVEKQRTHYAFGRKEAREISTEELFHEVLWRFRQYVEEKYQYESWFMNHEEV